MIIASLSMIGPLAAAILILLIRRWPAAIALSGSAVGLLAALITLIRIGNGDRFATTLPGLPDRPFRLAVDPITAVLSTVVVVVGMGVLIYAVGYMADEDGHVRFFAQMAFFVAMMQLLVLAGDWILFLTAWELIGLASYLLIGFWFTRPGIGSSATEAFLVTRAADVGLYLGTIIVITNTGSTAISATGDLKGHAGIAAGLALLLAAAGKSAQAPLQGWLSDAMVGPTPVSALLHAATLVVAGVILLSRAAPLLPPGILLLIGIVGGVSSIITGLTAIAQADLKRLLAASTSSQLGLMLLALGAGSIPAAIFHLVTHAAMKSTLFLAAGVFQHDRESTRFDDLRGIGRVHRGVFVAFALAGLALAGIPPLAGFWSKDAIIAAALQASSSWILAPLALFGSALTGVYVGRAIRLLWQPSETATSSAPVAGTARMKTGIFILAVLVMIIGLTEHRFGRFIEKEVPGATTALILGLVVAIGGLAVGWFVPARRLLGPARTLAQNGFRIGDGWYELVVDPSLALGRWCNLLDRRIHAGVHSVGHLALGLAGSSRHGDDLIHAGVEMVGHLGGSIAHMTDGLDRQGLDGLIALLVRRIRQLGQHARHLQSGLVHEELLVAAGGTAVLLLLVLLI